MAIHIVGTAATPVGPSTPGVAVRGIEITVNTGFSGTITVADGIGTQAVITNPVTGGVYPYYGLLSPVTVTNSAVGDTSVNLLSQRVG